MIDFVSIIWVSNACHAWWLVKFLDWLRICICYFSNSQKLFDFRRYKTDILIWLLRFLELSKIINGDDLQITYINTSAQRHEYFTLMFLLHYFNFGAFSTRKLSLLFLGLLLFVDEVVIGFHPVFFLHYLLHLFLIFLLFDQ